MSAELKDECSAPSCSGDLSAAGDEVPVPAGQQEGFHPFAGCLLLSQLQLSATAIMAQHSIGHPGMQAFLAMRLPQLLCHLQCM